MLVHHGWFGILEFFSESYLHSINGGGYPQWVGDRTLAATAEEVMGNAGAEGSYPYG